LIDQVNLPHYGFDREGWGLASIVTTFKVKSTVTHQKRTVLFTRDQREKILALREVSSVMPEEELSAKTSL